MAQKRKNYYRRTYKKYSKKAPKGTPLFNTLFIGKGGQFRLWFFMVAQIILFAAAALFANLILEQVIVNQSKTHGFAILTACIVICISVIGAYLRKGEYIVTWPHFMAGALTRKTSKGTRTTLDKYQNTPFNPPLNDYQRIRFAQYAVAKSMTFQSMATRGKKTLRFANM